MIFGLIILLFFSFAYAPSHWDILEQLTYSVDVDEASFDLAIVPIYTDEIKEMSSSSKKKECGQIADDLFDGDVIDTDVFDF